MEEFTPQQKSREQLAREVIPYSAIIFGASIDASPSALETLDRHYNRLKERIADKAGSGYLEGVVLGLMLAMGNKDEIFDLVMPGLGPIKSEKRDITVKDELERLVLAGFELRTPQALTEAGLKTETYNGFLRKENNKLTGAATNMLNIALNAGFRAHEMDVAGVSQASIYIRTGDDTVIYKPRAHELNPN